MEKEKCLVVGTPKRGPVNRISRFTKANNRVDSDYTFLGRDIRESLGKVVKAIEGCNYLKAGEIAKKELRKYQPPK
jgi:predicted NBD/HSP70 family sugar kinase